MMARMDELDASLSQGIDQTEQILGGSILATVDDEKRFSLMKEKMKVFNACVRAGGGESCYEGKHRINTGLN